MRTIKSLLVVALLGGCHMFGGGATNPRPEYGAKVADETPPESQETYFEAKAGKVWVPGRWARIDDQWKWQPGYYEDARAGQVYVAGYWDRDKKTGKFVWIDGRWEKEREGVVYVPGHWAKRGETVVWYRDRWEKIPAGHVWIEGGWTEENGERVWKDGHFAQLSASAQ
jgi:hypothetical protein